MHESEQNQAYVSTLLKGIVELVEWAKTTLKTREADLLSKKMSNTILTWKLSLSVTLQTENNSAVHWIPLYNSHYKVAHLF